MKRPITLTIAALTLAVGCADAQEAPSEEALTAPLSVAKADGLPGPARTFFQVKRHDARRCLFPVCSGDFIVRLNQASVRCADGQSRDECYVADYDFSALGISQSEAAALKAEIRAGRAIARGEIVNDYFSGFEDIGVLAVTEVWLGSGSGASKKARYYQTNHNGTLCVAHPCPSYDGILLNHATGFFDVYADVDLSGAGATEAELEAAHAALFDSSIIVAGRVLQVSGPAGEARALEASRLYLKFTADAGPTCGTSGSSPCPEGMFCQWDDEADTCGASGRPGTCVPRPAICTEEYAPVCGCDGVTYDNDCFRQAAGVGFATPGVCPGSVGQVCGARGSAPCPEGMFCQWDEEADMCGAFDAPGVCVERPTLCTLHYEPVCGCDGVTYNNDCARQASGVGFSTPGACVRQGQCVIGGCAGQLCLEASAAPAEQEDQLCPPSRADACYQRFGYCERQGTGECGWTPTKDLQACLERAAFAPRPSE